MSQPEIQSEIGSEEALYLELGKDVFKLLSKLNERLQEKGGVATEALFNQLAYKALCDVKNTLNEIHSLLTETLAKASHLKYEHPISQPTQTIRSTSEKEHSLVAYSHSRLAREESRRIALETARKLIEEGREINLAKVARESGLKYGQIVYAFRNKDNFMSAVEEMLSESQASRTSA